MAHNSPDTGATTYSYDSAGNRVGQIDARGIQTSYSYDALNRLTGVDLPTAGQDIEIFYDVAAGDCQAGETYSAGLLSRFTDSSGSTAYCYNQRGNLTRKVQSVAGDSLTVTYGYNLADGVANITYPSGATVSYQRDAGGRITGVLAKPSASAAEVVLVSDVEYLPFGPATQLTFGNGRVLAKAFDQNYGIAGITDSALDGMDLDYTLDAVGNVTGLAERVTGGNMATRAIDYDGLDRLTALKDGASTVQAFTYDATGNRTSKTAGTTEAYTYPVDSHRLTAVGGVARGYDAAGNTTTMGASRAFLYDDRGRLAQLTDGGVPTREYAYNAHGERVAKRNPTVSGGDITYVYDESGHLLGEYDASGLRIKEYVWLDDTLVAVLGDHGGSDHQYVLTDHLGTPRAVVHPGSNALLWRWDLTASAFGDHHAQSDPDGDGATYSLNLRYPGQYFDAETGLHYNYFRDYDPSTGRYVQSDPIGLAGGPSTFSYVSASPMTAIDPKGLLENFTFTLNRRESSKLKCECGQEFDAFSGQGDAMNNPDYEATANVGPIPRGTYYIVDRPTGGRFTRADKNAWFGLFRYGAEDGLINDTTAVGTTLRGQFRLHPGTISEGCVTLRDEEQFRVLSDLLRKTESSKIPGTDITYYGTITVN